ncbi:MAG TPA: PAS domain S-box protein [Thermoanaerobaculia bacterium]|jgi:PAS domain S-box-containing protein|nr:PAS domain S-box protein [Thermoanaerobaculia bacterium]
MPAKIGPTDNGISASLTDWLEKERELALRDEWHQLVLANTSDLISTHTPDTAFVFVSGACRRLLGYEPEELAGRSIFEFMHTDDLENAARIHRALLDSSEFQVLTYRFRCSDGRYLWTETTFRVMGRPLGNGREYWVAVTRDVSGHKEAEEQQVRLRRALERAAFEWRSTFDAIRSPVLLVGLDGCVQRLNRAARDLLGQDYREILGRAVEELGSGQPWATVAALARRVLESFVPEVCEATDESREKTWEVEAVASSGSESKVIVQVRDITKTARLQESLRRSETMAALGAVVGGVAHEVRNPLFGMSAVLDAFESRFGDRDEHRPYLPMLRTEIGRMTELMQALLDYGKPARFEMAPLDISAAVDGALELCRPLAERQGVLLERRAEAASPPVLLDLHQLTQALKNVVENAVQHSPAGGQVTIESVPFTVEDGPWVRLSVRDRGPGFPPADLPRVLEPFFSRRSGGTGLGLSIVSRVVEGHGGRLRAANHPEGGAVVDLELPCLRQAEEP